VFCYPRYLRKAHVGPICNINRGGVCGDLQFLNDSLQGSYCLWRWGTEGGRWVLNRSEYLLPSGEVSLSVAQTPVSEFTHVEEARCGTNYVSNLIEPFNAFRFVGRLSVHHFTTCEFEFCESAKGKVPRAVFKGGDLDKVRGGGGIMKCSILCSYIRFFSPHKRFRSVVRDSGIEW
jgi:hypothetical protein